jgi:light-regulated signal transduction histidine kinase (bacteriophytochrome)
MVASYVELLRKRYQGKLDADADEFIGYAVDGAKRLHEMIQGLLAYSRSHAKLQVEPVALGEIFELAVASLQVAAQECGATLTIGEMPLVQADARQLMHVAQNLLANAIRYRGSEPPNIQISAADGGDRWTIRVKDNGIGIAAKYHQRIFQMFQRLHTREEYPGAGIGLALCRRIVEHHGGSIGVESDVGTGSTFFFTLPKEQPE